MGQPNTKPMIAQRWPRNAEKQRQNIYHMAEDGRELADEGRKRAEAGRILADECRRELNGAIGKLITNPGLAELMIRKAITGLADIQTALADFQGAHSDIETILGDIQKEAMAARIGVEPPQQETDGNE